MNRKFLQISLLALIWFVIFSCSEEKEQAKNSAAALNAEEQKVVDYLLADWNKQFRSTSIPLAMKNLDLQPDDDFRLNIARYFRKHTDLANNLKWWGVNNYLLSNDEKLIAKYLIKQYDQEQRLPDLTTLAEAVDLTETVVNAKLNFLVRAGLLLKSENTETGFVLTKSYATWGGPLRFNFHTVAMAGKKPFDVW